MDIERINATKDAHSERLRGLEGINGVGIGFVDDGSSLGIIVFRESGSDTPVPSDLDGIPVLVRTGSFAALGETLDEVVSVDKPVEEKRRMLGNPRDKEVEPMIGGISTNPNYFFGVDGQGTLGIIIRDGRGSAVVLSNRHVICKKNPQVGDEVAQPSYEILPHLAATLTDWELGNHVYQGRAVGMDAAIASPTNGRTGAVGQIYGLQPVTGTVAARVGMGVQKSGLATDITTGTVTVISCDLATPAGVVLRNQMLARPSVGVPVFAAEGDSGSVIVELGTGLATSLLWGGVVGTTEVVASPIDAILDRFNCTLP